MSTTWTLASINTKDIVKKNIELFKFGMPKLNLMSQGEAFNTYQVETGVVDFLAAFVKK